ncbi:hypothetical protein CYMTET_23679 [Cymbomonas tetramitiformis]|uniref:Reverse transcriptase domain-containing protein n=1 Tax=Cymbomonas tetramitiformis TaxID=36881 RepID=A0AAE0FYU0_9CHLO|nr:hypothetical protein CYMTET_23679 [Cymbomonas tetramitiformis]
MWESWDTQDVRQVLESLRDLVVGPTVSKAEWESVRFEILACFAAITEPLKAVPQEVLAATRELVMLGLLEEGAGSDHSRALAASQGKRDGWSVERHKQVRASVLAEGAKLRDALLRFRSEHSWKRRGMALEAHAFPELTWSRPILDEEGCDIDELPAGEEASLEDCQSLDAQQSKLVLGEDGRSLQWESANKWTRCSTLPEWERGFCFVLRKDYTREQQLQPVKAKRPWVDDRGPRGGKDKSGKGAKAQNDFPNPPRDGGGKGGKACTFDPCRLPWGIFALGMMEKLRNGKAQGIPCVGYLDDFFMVAATREAAEEMMMLLVEVVSFLGFRVNAAKCEGPEQLMEFLGVELSTSGEVCTAAINKDRVDFVVRTAKEGRTVVVRIDNQ